MENISLQILRICIFVYATELQTAQLILLAEPCPDITPSTTIADMCTNDFANEEPGNGGATADSVALRVMTQQDGCTCEVSLQNQTKIYTVYMRKYDLLTKAAPKHEACGLAIDIYYTSPENFPENKYPIECTKGINSRSIVLSQNGVVHLSSRVIGGNFSRGYCMQIYRSHVTGDNVDIQINCSRPNMQTTKTGKTVSRNIQTTQPITDASIKDKTVSNDMQTTQQMTDAAIHDKTASDTDSTMYIAIGVGFGVLGITLFVVVAFIIIRRKGKRNKNGIEEQPDIDSTDDDSDELKYNTLYNASEQQEIMEGNYHTVELEEKQNRTGIQNFDSDYSTVDGNYSSVDIVNMPAKESESKSTSNTPPRSETQRTKGGMSSNLKHVTAGSNAEYAVVDKSDRTDQNIKHISAPNDINVEYAVIDKR